MCRALIAIILIVWVQRAWLVLWVQPPNDLMYVYPNLRADQLLVGCLLAVILKREMASTFFQVLSSSNWSPVITALLLFVSAHLQVRYGYTYTYLIGFTLDPVLAAILIVQLISLHSQFPWRWLNWRVVRYMGVISYSLYLYHMLLAQTAVHTFLKQYLRGSVEFAVKVALTVLLASASFWLVERPFLKLKSRYATQSSS